MGSLASFDGHNSATDSTSSLNWGPVHGRLTRKERELLAILMQNPGRCISRDTLLRTVWKYSAAARTRTVDVHVQRLRRKLGREAASIKTIVRLGYCWFPEPDSINRPSPVW